MGAVVKVRVSETVIAVGSAHLAPWESDEPRRQGHSKDQYRS